VNILLYIDVIEACLFYIPQNRKTCKIKFGCVLKILEKTRKYKSHGIVVSEVKSIIKEVFPIHKNMNKRVKVLKISIDSANKFLDENNLTIRPLEHIKKLADNEF